MNQIKRLPLFLCFCLLVQIGFSQSDTIRLNEDTLQIEYLFAEDLTFRKEAKTSLDNFQFYNPVLGQPFGYTFLSNYGAPHKQLIYQPRIREGFDIGLHQYDLYRRTKSSIRFYNSARPYTDLKYVAGGQEDAVITAVFSQNLNKRTNILFDYKKLIHRGAYQEQRVRHTNMVFSAWHRSKNDRYLAFLSWNNNLIKNQNNGGIVNEADLTDNAFGNRILVPVNVETAQTEYTTNEFSLTQYLSFSKKKKDSIPNLPAPKRNPKLPPIEDETPIRSSNGGNFPQYGGVVNTPKQSPKDTVPPVLVNVVQDSIKKPPSFLKKDRKMEPLEVKSSLVHHFAFEDIEYKFFDNAPATDSSFYGIYQTNQRGIRHFLRIRKIENSFSAPFAFGQAKFEDAPLILIKPKLSHRIYFINQEPLKSVLNNLFVGGDLAIKPPVKDMDLRVNFHYGLADNLGDLTLKGTLKSGLGSLGDIEAFILQQRYKPNLIQQQFYISQVKLWDNDFVKTNELNLGFQYHFPKWKVKAGVQYHLIDNYIYYNNQSIPAQFTGALNILQLMAWNDFKIWKINVENQVVFQQTGNTYLRLPKFWSKHSLFIEGKIFKKVMLSRLGFDLRYNTNYQADRYLPQSGQFYLQDDQNLKFYPVLDLFVSFKVKTFRALFKVENLSQLVSNKTYLTAPNYPMRDWMIRFGIAWRFFD